MVPLVECMTNQLLCIPHIYSLSLSLTHTHRQALLQCGFDPNQYSSTLGQSCLEAAAQHGHVSCVRLLCDAGAALLSGPSLLAQPRKTPLMHAAGTLRGLQCMLNIPEPMSHASVHTEHGHLCVVELLCTHQPSALDALCQGHTALNMACDAGHLPVVEKLLQHGAYMASFGM